MFDGGNLSPTAQAIAERSRAFHAHIAAQAAKVVAPESRTYFIPNVPYGARKAKPQPPKEKPIDLALHCRGMWFYDLVWPCSRREAAARVDVIINTVARTFGLSKHEIRSSRRTANEVIPRQLAMFLCKELTTRSLPEIGRRLGGKDHTTVIHGIRRARRRLEVDSDFAACYQAIKLELCS